MPIYAYASLGGYDFLLGRAFGAGLGNLLFPWARYVIFCATRRVLGITPTWSQVKLGPWVRGERDKRSYCGYFSAAPGEIGGLRKFYLLATRRVVDESLAQTLDLEAGEMIVRFAGTREKFRDILEQHGLILGRLVSITRTKHKKEALEFDFRNSISLHIRRCDFSRPTDAAELYSGKENLQIPIDWYARTLDLLRPSESWPAFVFSDGSDAELAEILRKPNVRRLCFGSAIADLLALSRSNALIASGSSFSRWACFLGRMPVVWFRGQLEQHLYRESSASEIEVGLAEAVPSSFVRRICASGC